MARVVSHRIDQTELAIHRMASLDFEGTIQMEPIGPGWVATFLCGRCRWFSNFHGKPGDEKDICNFLILLERHSEPCHALPIMFRRRPDSPWCPACGRTYRSTKPFAKCMHPWHRLEVGQEAKMGSQDDD